MVLATEIARRSSDRSSASGVTDDLDRCWFLAADRLRQSRQFVPNALDFAEKGIRCPLGPRGHPCPNDPAGADGKRSAGRRWRRVRRDSGDLGSFTVAWDRSFEHAAL